MTRRAHIPARTAGAAARRRGEVVAVGRWWMRAAVSALLVIPVAAVAERAGFWWLAALTAAVLLASWAVASVAISVHVLRWMALLAHDSLLRAREQATGNGPWLGKL